MYYHLWSYNIIYWIVQASLYDVYYNSNSQYYKNQNREITWYLYPGSALWDAIVLAVVSREQEGTYGYKITQDVRR